MEAIKQKLGKKGKIRDEIVVATSWVINDQVLLATTMITVENKFEQKV